MRGREEEREREGEKGIKRDEKGRDGPDSVRVMFPCRLHEIDRGSQEDD